MWPSAANTAQPKQRSKSARHFASVHDELSVEDEEGTDVMWPSAAQNNRVSDDNNYTSNRGRHSSSLVRRPAPAVPHANRAGAQRLNNNWMSQSIEMPPAGKASIHGTASVLPQGDLNDLQNTLSALMIRKQNVS